MILIRKLKKTSLFVLFLLQFTARTVLADTADYYNLTVSAEVPEDGYFDEVIEVYVEKDNKFYTDIDLSPINDYVYKTEVPSGTYVFKARVRYDVGGNYIMTPSSTEEVINSTGLPKEVVFTAGGRAAEDGRDIHPSHNTERIDNPATGSYIFSSADDFSPEEWEKKNSFTALNGISNPGIPEEISGSVHIYPDESGENTETDNETVKNDTDTKESKQEREEEDIKTDRYFAAVISGMIFILIAAAILWVHLKKGTDDER